MVHAIGALSALGQEAAALNVKRPLVVTDQGIVKAGLLDEALKPLWAVITDPDRKVKFNVGGTPNIASWVALVDPALSVNLPAGVTAGTGMDALTHAIECYTMAYHQPFTDAVALLAMEYCGRYLRVAYAQGHNLEARYHMSMGAMLAGLAYGTDSAGAAHAMSQTAGGVHDAPHGALTGRLLAPVMEYNYAGEPERFARIGRALGLEVANKPVC